MTEMKGIYRLREALDEAKEVISNYADITKIIRGKISPCNMCVGCENKDYCRCEVCADFVMEALEK